MIEVYLINDVRSPHVRRSPYTELAMKEVKLNTCGIKYTPSTCITYYEVSTNFPVVNEEELLTLDEVKAVLNAHKPIIERSRNHWSIGISTPLRELHLRSKRF